MMAAKKQVFANTIKSLLDGIVSVPLEYDATFNDLVIDSRQVKQGDVFVAIDGDGINGIEYIDAAIDSGASAVLWDAQVDAISFAWSKHNKNVPLIAIINLKDHLATLANERYDQPSKNLNIVAVTGTNGKTSCVNYIAQALGVDTPCGLIGTLGMGIYPNIVMGTHTTPDVLTVHKTLASFIRNGAKFSAIEVSSHALAQGRVDGVEIDIAIFTNLTQDHLDYHGTMEAYLNEKSKLFENPNLKTAIININERYGLDIVKAAKGKNIITYGFYQNINTPDVYASDIQYFPDRTEFVLNVKQGSVLISSALVGDFNISNMLAVCAYLQVQGYSLNSISECVKNILPVQGRMQKIHAKGFPTIIVDYAHTPDALEQVLKSLSEQFNSAVTCVFGCGGDRDTDKRSKMGKVADDYANTIILTNDNPRTESPEAIAAQISLGIVNKNKVTIELDRSKAISFAIKDAPLNGCVLVAGKGHEDYQVIGDVKHEFNDVEVVKKIVSGQ